MAGFFNRAYEEKDFPSKLLITIVDKIVIGLVLLGFGALVNTKLEHFKAIETQRASLTKMQFDALMSVYTKLHAVEVTLVAHEASLRAAICEAYPKRSTYDLVTPGAKDYREIEDRVNDAITEAIRMPTALRGPILTFERALMSYRDAIDGTPSNKYSGGVVGCALHHPTPPPETCQGVEDMARWFSPCAEPIVTAMNDVQHAEMALYEAVEAEIEREESGSP
jgi:hypothetical protein